MMKRRLLSLCWAGALVLTLAACSGDTPITHPTPTPAPPAETTPIPGSPDLPLATPEDATAPLPENTPDLPEPPPENTGPDAATVHTQLTGAWNDREAKVTFGMDPDAACPLAVLDARAGLNDVTVALIPLGSGAYISAFQKATVRIPHTTVSYDIDAGALVIRLTDTVLDTGDPADAVGSDDWVFDFIGEHSLTYPHSFPMGSLGEDNRFFEGAAISSDGTDTTVTLRLTGRAMEYRVESGSLDKDGMLPYFRITFQE